MSRIGNKIITVPEGVTVEIADDNTVTVTGSKGTLVKQFSPAISFKQMAALIRSKKKPEPYKGKGIKYSDERIIRKEGKTAGKK